MNNLWFWAWCRWTKHQGATFKETCFEKAGVHPIYMRSCLRCDRVLESDVLHILNVLEVELDKMEAEIG